MHHALNNEQMKAIQRSASSVLSAFLVLLLVFSFSSSSYGQQTGPSTAPITTEELVKYTKESNFIKEFQVPVEERGLKGIVTDPSGDVWIYYSTNRSSTIFKFDLAKQTFTQFPVEGQTTVDDPVINLGAGHLAFDNETNSVWFTDSRTNSIGKLDVRTGVVQLIPIPTKNAGPMGIALGPDGQSIWFTEITADKIAKLDVKSMGITEYSTGAESGPTLLSFDDKGILWVSLSFSHSVLRINARLLSSNPSAAMDELQLPGNDEFSPFGIALSGGKLYISDHGSSRVVVNDVGFANYDSYWTSPAKEFPTTLPGEVVADKQGNIYFPQHGGNRISMIDKMGVVTEYEIPTGPLSTVLFVAASNDGKVWFTEWASNKIGYLDTNVKMPFDIQTEQAAGGITLTKDKSQSIDLTFTKHSNIDNSSVSLSEVGIAVIGMTESGLRGVTYTAQPPRVNLDQNQQPSIKITLNAVEGAMPGKYTLMVRATVPEKDGLLVSKLYPISLVLDVPAPSSQNNNPSNTVTEQVSTDSLIRDITRILAASVAVGLVGYLIYRRVRKKSDITK